MPRQFKPINQLRVWEEVAEQLKDSILSGDFKPGDKLPSERELAEQFQVGRIAVREALRSLANSGFVAMRHGAAGGAFVTDLTFSYLESAYLDLFLSDKISISELCQARLHIEPEIARLAAQRVTPDFAELLNKALEVEELQAHASLMEDIESKQTVHLILAEMCGNRFFEGFARSMLAVLRKVAVGVEADYLHPEGAHRPIIEAVLAGDPDGAEEAMKKHAVEFGEALLALLRVDKEVREKASRDALAPSPQPQRKKKARGSES
jgi:GntR family transcriptional regulator, transcriptional repressor for pyruvate dehydrogenase complex